VTPIASVVVGAVASGAVPFLLGLGPPGTAATIVVTALAVTVGWVVDRLVRGVVASRRERSRFLAALDEVDDVVARRRHARARELADWYPTADRVGEAHLPHRSTRVLVLGVGRASSGIELEGEPEDDLAPGDPALSRLARLREQAAVLDDAPLCVRLGSTVRVVGPPVLAEAVASGLRRQLRAAGASSDEAAAHVDWVAVPPVDEAPPPAPPPAGARPVDTVVVIGTDGEATVTRKDGVPCRQPVRVAFVSVRDGPGPGEPSSNAVRPRA
jgi:hypothetical protein